jgi:trk system potassium uptake protein TrkA
MNIIIVGCGRVGSELAYRLFQKGHNVTIIDYTAASFQNLHPDFRGLTIEGEALNRDVLHRAGIESADGFVAVSNSDSLNAVVCYLARIAYGIQNVVVRNYDPTYRPLHEAFGNQIISSSSWGAQRFEEMLNHAEMRTVFSAGNGEVEIYEFSVEESWDGKRLGDLLPGDVCVPVSLTRSGIAILPNCDTILAENDVVLVSATFEGIEQVRQHLSPRSER